MKTIIAMYQNNDCGIRHFYVKEENLDSYVQELRKWLALQKLVKRGFGVSERLSEFCDMTAEDINFLNGYEESHFNIATAVTYFGEKTGNKLSDILKF